MVVPPSSERPVHGGLNLVELETLGLDPREVIDFSASINPLGPSPLALEAIQCPELASYPDPECTELRRAIGRLKGVGVDRIVVGNGSTELIHLLARALLGPDDNAVVFSPTFGEYAAACRLQGVEPVVIPALARLQMESRPCHRHDCWTAPEGRVPVQSQQPNRRLLGCGRSTKHRRSTR